LSDIGIRSNILMIACAIARLTVTVRTGILRLVGTSLFAVWALYDSTCASKIILLII